MNMGTLAVLGVLGECFLLLPPISSPLAITSRASSRHSLLLLSLAICRQCLQCTSTGCRRGKVGVWRRRRCVAVDEEVDEA